MCFCSPPIYSVTYTISFFPLQCPSAIVQVPRRLPQRSASAPKVSGIAGTLIPPESLSLSSSLLLFRGSYSVPVGIDQHGRRHVQCKRGSRSASHIDNRRLCLSPLALSNADPHTAQISSLHIRFSPLALLLPLIFPCYRPAGLRRAHRRQDRRCVSG